MRLINENDEQVGIVSIEKALALAREAELDLVEVAPVARPPVCKIIDFGKFLYKQKKLEQKQRHASKQQEVKAIRLSMRIGTHDMEVKAKKAKNFLADRNIVKIAMVMRGREMAYMNLAREKMNVFAQMLAQSGEIKEPPKKQGNNLIMMIGPK
ncbi:translation initiation factor IF-3 [Candidatus Peregrinibacteria bacterium]|nr:translation initiation factor IF-3 [Candidatus Peregrinibacteria bacterium]